MYAYPVTINIDFIFLISLNRFVIAVYLKNPSHNYANIWFIYVNVKRKIIVIITHTHTYIHKCDTGNKLANILIDSIYMIAYKFLFCFFLYIIYNLYIFIKGKGQSICKLFLQNNFIRLCQ